MILSGIAVLVMLLTINSIAVSAVVIGPPKIEGTPEVFLVKKEFLICKDGASIPPSGISGEGESQSGCVDTGYPDRLNEYLFTGEQMGWLVLVKDDNGAEDVVGAHLLVDDVERVKCNRIDNVHSVTDFMGHAVDVDINDLIADNGGSESKYVLYKCLFTATSSDYSPEDGSQVYVEAFDQAGNTGMSVIDNVFLNPAISLDIWVEPDDVLTFPAGQIAQTVYSVDTLKIKNTAEGGVDLFAWLAATNMEAADGAAKCPESNIIDVEEALEFRCKVGTMMDNTWRKVANPDDTLACGLDACQGAKPLVVDTDLSIIGNMHTAECWFRFTYPDGICVGDFTEGGHVIIYARAI